MFSSSNKSGNAKVIVMKTTHLQNVFLHHWAAATSLQTSVIIALIGYYTLMSLPAKDPFHPHFWGCLKKEVCYPAICIGFTPYVKPWVIWVLYHSENLQPDIWTSPLCMDGRDQDGNKRRGPALLLRIVIWMSRQRPNRDQVLRAQTGIKFQPSTLSPSSLQNLSYALFCRTEAESACLL